VPAVEAARGFVLPRGGTVGDVVTTETADGRHVTWSYVTDPRATSSSCRAGRSARHAGRCADAPTMTLADADPSIPNDDPGSRPRPATPRSPGEKVMGGSTVEASDRRPGQHHPAGRLAAGAASAARVLKFSDHHVGGFCEMDVDGGFVSSNYRLERDVRRLRRRAVWFDPAVRVRGSAQPDGSTDTVDVTEGTDHVDLSASFPIVDANVRPGAVRRR
jgi:hypothetical protein